MLAAITQMNQADAFAALLDARDIRQIDVIGFSAGVTSAMQLALRHAGRVKHLALLVANLPGSPTAVVEPSWTKRINRQFVMWALRTFAPSTTARLVVAVPREFAMSGDVGVILSVSGIVRWVRTVPDALANPGVNTIIYEDRSVQGRSRRQRRSVAARCSSPRDHARSNAGWRRHGHPPRVDHVNGVPRALPRAGSPGQPGAGA
jgi:pimeloyl-ACP methyl ester carboxylesterase